MPTLRAKLLSIAEPGCEVQLEVLGRRLCAMATFESSEARVGHSVDIELTSGLLDEDESWESMFAGNPAARCDLDSLSSWRYRAYGLVREILPVVVDCGVLHLEAPVSTHDPRVVGEAIAFTVDRLDASL